MKKISVYILFYDTIVAVRCVVCSPVAVGGGASTIVSFGSLDRKATNE